ncbi:hypothetical protein HC002_02325 [Limosilactobacillus fermentum]
MGNNKTCPYCSPDKKVMMPIIEDGSDFLAVEDNGTIAFGDDGAVTHYERMLNFCPMCGRELNNGKKQLQMAAKRLTKANAKKKEPEASHQESNNSTLLQDMKKGLNRGRRTR